MAPLADVHPFAAVHEALDVGLGQLAQVAEVRVVALSLRMDDDVQGVMEVVQPLRSPIRSRT